MNDILKKLYEAVATEYEKNPPAPLVEAVPYTKEQFDALLDSERVTKALAEKDIDINNIRVNQIVDAGTILGVGKRELDEIQEGIELKRSFSKLEKGLSQSKDTFEDALEEAGIHNYNSISVATIVKVAGITLEDAEILAENSSKSVNGAIATGEGIDKIAGSAYNTDHNLGAAVADQTAVFDVFSRNDRAELVEELNQYKDLSDHQRDVYRQANNVMDIGYRPDLGYPQSGTKDEGKMTLATLVEVYNDTYNTNYSLNNLPEDVLIGDPSKGVPKLSTLLVDNDGNTTALYDAINYVGEKEGEIHDLKDLQKNVKADSNSEEVGGFVDKVASWKHTPDWAKDLLIGDPKDVDSKTYLNEEQATTYANLKDGTAKDLMDKLQEFTKGNAEERAKIFDNEYYDAARAAGMIEKMGVVNAGASAFTKRFKGDQSENPSDWETTKGTLSQSTNYAGIGLKEPDDLTKNANDWTWTTSVANAFRSTVEGTGELVGIGLTKEETLKDWEMARKTGSLKEGQPEFSTFKVKNEAIGAYINEQAGVDVNDKNTQERALKTVSNDTIINPTDKFLNLQLNEQATDSTAVDSTNVDSTATDANKKKEDAKPKINPLDALKDLNILESDKIERKKPDTTKLNTIGSINKKEETNMEIDMDKVNNLNNFDVANIQQEIVLNGGTPPMSDRAINDNRKEALEKLENSDIPADLKPAVALNIKWADDTRDFDAVKTVIAKGSNATEQDTTNLSGVTLNEGITDKALYEQKVGVVASVEERGTGVDEITKRDTPIVNTPNNGIEIG